MPESVDVNKPGQLDLTTNEITSARVERACAQSDEVHVFRGREEPAKEVDCVLIYDPESGMFTLEKLDSTFTLTHEGKTQPKARPTSASPLPTPSPATNIKDEIAEEIFREMEQTLASTKEDSKGEDSDNAPLIDTKRPAHLPPKPEPARPPPMETDNKGRYRPKLKPKPPTDLTSSSLPTPLIATTTITVQPTSSAPKRNINKGKETRAQTHTIEVEEEELNFGMPSKPTKRSRISPQTEPPPVASSSTTSLALPGAETAIVLPSSDGFSLSGKDVFPSLPQAPVDDDDDDDEWVDATSGVPINNTSTMQVPQPIISSGGDEIFQDGFADSGEVDDLNEELIRELRGDYEEEDFGDGFAGGYGDNGDGDMGGDDDSDMEDIFGAEEPAPDARPQSMMAYAADHNGASSDEEEDSEDSSDISD